MSVTSMSNLTKSNKNFVVAVACGSKLTATKNSTVVIMASLRLSKDFSIHAACEYRHNDLFDDNQRDLIRYIYNPRMSNIKMENLDLFDPATVHIVSGYIRHIETNLLSIYNGKTFYNIPLNVALVCLQFVKDVDIMRFDGIFDFEDDNLSDTEINGPIMICDELKWKPVKTHIRHKPFQSMDITHKYIDRKIEIISYNSSHSYTSSDSNETTNAQRYHSSDPSLDFTDSD